MSAIVTPLIVRDAEALAQLALGEPGGWTRAAVVERVTGLVMRVDVASREQAVEPLILALAALGMRADEEGDLVARGIAADAIDTARGRKKATRPPDDFIDSPTDGYSMPKKSS